MARLSGELVRSIKLAHAKQLAGQEIPPAQHIPEEVPPPDMLKSAIDWIKANPGALKAAQNTQCTSESPDKPNWDAVFFSLMESSAMYLRKVGEMVKAILAAREGDFELALEHLELAQEDINTVAKALEYFSKQSPEGTWMHSGAFCGVFISNDTSKPFMGVAFKGSNSTRDLVTDLDWSPIAPPTPGVVFDAKVHRGFYLGLFGKFKVGDDFEIPFDLLVKQLDLSYDDHARVHFTGHSLGGAFCTLAYGEFLRRQHEQPIKQFNFGDMYSLAAPRVCLEPFADQVNTRTKPGGGKYLFRVVNRNDPVPTVPPRTANQVVDFPFIHVGGAWELTGTGPGKMHDEPPPMTPQPVAKVIWNIKDHMTSDYYANWQKTQHS